MLFSLAAVRTSHRRDGRRHRPPRLGVPGGAAIDAVQDRIRRDGTSEDGGATFPTTGRRLRPPFGLASIPWRAAHRLQEALPFAACATSRMAAPLSASALRRPMLLTSTSTSAAS